MSSQTLSTSPSSASTTVWRPSIRGRPPLMTVQRPRSGSLNMLIPASDHPDSRSAGATLALATLLRLRDRSAVDGFTCAALQFGAYDLSAQTPAGRQIEDEYFIQAYVGRVEDRTTPDISPRWATSAASPQRC